MLDLKIDASKCTSCKACVTDCPAMIIEMGDNGLPFIAEANEKKCYKCQHCLAICPTAALSILGKKPEDSVAAFMCPTTEQVDALIRNRRSVRRFRKEDVSPVRLETIFKAAANAPTGKNDRQVTLHIVRTREQMNKVTDLIVSRIEKADRDGELTEGKSIFAVLARHFRNGNDIIFRNAPHMLLASTPKTAPTPLADGFIALSYAELMAHTLNVGVVWAGFVSNIFGMFPDLLVELGVPEDHVFAYPLLLGTSALRYPRGVQRDEIDVHDITL